MRFFPHLVLQNKRPNHQIVFSLSLFLLRILFFVYILYFMVVPFGVVWVFFFFYLVRGRLGFFGFFIIFCSRSFITSLPQPQFAFFGTFPPPSFPLPLFRLLSPPQTRRALQRVSTIEHRVFLVIAFPLFFTCFFLGSLLPFLTKVGVSPYTHPLFQPVF